jgi:hypothetical protein
LVDLFSVVFGGFWCFSGIFSVFFPTPSSTELIVVCGVYQLMWMNESLGIKKKRLTALSREHEPHSMIYDSVVGCHSIFCYNKYATFVLKLHATFVLKLHATFVLKLHATFVLKQHTSFVLKQHNTVHNNTLVLFLKKKYKCITKNISSMKNTYEFIIFQRLSCWRKLSHQIFRTKFLAPRFMGKYIFVWKRRKYVHTFFATFKWVNSTYVLQCESVIF